MSEREESKTGGRGEAEDSNPVARTDLAAELEERFLGLAENSPSMIFINRGGRVVYANPRAEEVLGYTMAELCAPDFDYRRLVAVEHLPLVGRAFAEHMAGKNVAQYEYGLVTKDGRRLDAINATRLIFDLDPDLPPVSADAGQVQQVIMNLITNAAEAIGDATGTITVRARLGPADPGHPDLVGADHGLGEGDYLHLEVSDTGCGMDAETKSRIFDPFFSTKLAGRGLGLAAVLGIVRGHNGALTLSSEVGVGTTVRVILPTIDAPAGSEGRREPGAGKAGGGTVLVVDDEPIVREVAEAMFESLGIETLSATDGQQALEIFDAHANRIDAVLLDLTMPGLDGEEVFRRLRELCAELPIILSSGYDENEAVGCSSELGATGFLKKPYTIDDLVEVWSRVVS